MPIRPENLARYPADWPAISLRIRKDRAADRCECQGECGHDHAGRCPELNGQPNSITGAIVVLTVAHLDHTPERSNDDNLRAMCQRCHLAYDRDHHVANVKRTHSLRRIASAGTLELFNEDLGNRTQSAPPVVAPVMSAPSPAWPFGDLVRRQYGAIIADPPWRFLNRSAKGEAKNPAAHYPCVRTGDLAALPVAQLAAPDCALFMWATAPMLDQAFALMSAWGFAFKSAGSWAKRSSADGGWAFGTGYCFRSASEFYLLGTIGKPRVLSRSIRNLIVAPIREHSRKPDQLHRDVEQLYAGPYAELFGRQRRDGWDVWGNDADRFEP